MYANATFNQSNGISHAAVHHLAMGSNQTALPQTGAFKLTVSNLYRDYSEDICRNRTTETPYYELKDELGIYSPTTHEKGTRKQGEMMYYYTNELESYLNLPYNSNAYFRIGTEFAAKAQAPQADVYSQTALSKAVNLSLSGAGYDFDAKKQPVIDRSFGRMGGQTPHYGKSGLFTSRYESKEYAQRFTAVLASIKDKTVHLLRTQKNHIALARQRGHEAFAEQLVHRGKLILIGASIDELAAQPEQVRALHQSITRIDSAYKKQNSLLMQDLDREHAMIANAERRLLPNI